MSCSVFLAVTAGWSECESEVFTASVHEKQRSSCSFDAPLQSSAAPLDGVCIAAGGVQELDMAVLASLLDQFGLEASEHMVCFDRLGVRRIEMHAPPVHRMARGAAAR